MDDAAINDLADHFSDALAAEQRLQPLADHRWEIFCAACQLVVAVIEDIEDDGYRDYVCGRFANHVATLPSRLDAAKRPKLRLVMSR